LSEKNCLKETIKGLPLLPPPPLLSFKGKKEEGEMFFEEKGRRKVVGPFEGGSKDKKQCVFLNQFHNENL
jgi:hypothetical protein